MASEAEAQNETRHDYLGREIILTANRAKRPHDFKHERAPRLTPPEKCFFCPGNEHLTPPEIDRIESAKGKWQVRCFPNKFCAVGKEYPGAYGSHEIIVETPEHSKTVSQLSLENWRNILEMYCRRLEAHHRDKKIRQVIIFKNEGKEAGASLEHTHLQLVALDHIPPLVQKKLPHLRKGKCYFCNLHDEEFSQKFFRIGMRRKAPKFQSEDRRRIIFENKHLVCFTPYAPRFNFEVWLANKRHVPSPDKFSKAELEAWAAALKKILGKLDLLLNFPPYNVVFNNGPFGKDFHFHVEIMPRLANWAGFEFGAESVLNSVLPEDAAEEMRK